MRHDDFFAGWGNISLNSREIKTQPIQQEPFVKSEEQLQFELNPKEYFECNGEDCISLVPNFLNEELISRDPYSFVYGYNQILKEICFSENRDIPVCTLFQILISSNGSKESISTFILETGLFEKTQKAFKILNMEEEWDTFEQIFQSGNLDVVN